MAKKKAKPKPQPDVWVLVRFVDGRQHIKGVTADHGHATRWAAEIDHGRVAGPFKVE